MNNVNQQIKLGSKIENDFAHRSEKNVSKGVQQLVQFQSRCYGFKKIAQQKTPGGKEYTLMHFQKNANQVEYSSLLGNIVTTSHAVSRSCQSELETEK